MGNFQLGRCRDPSRTRLRAPIFSIQPERLAGGLHA